MPARRGFLCSRCGSSEREEVSETESRCANCGLGATHGTLRAYASSSQPLSVEQRQQVQSKAREHADELARVLANASFLAYGLDRQWTGLRFVGGHSSSFEQVVGIELAHGNAPFDMAATQIRVATANDDDVFTAARSLVEHFWHETGILSEEVRRGVFVTDQRGADPLEPWGSATIPVDGVATDFRTLTHDNYAVALAPVGEMVVSIRAREWPLANVGLVAVTDIAPYVEGSRSVR